MKTLCIHFVDGSTHDVELMGNFPDSEFRRMIETSMKYGFIMPTEDGSCYYPPTSITKINLILK